MHRQMNFSWSSCYNRSGGPKSNFPPMIMVEPVDSEWKIIHNTVAKYVEDNGYDFNKVRDLLYSLIPDEFNCEVYGNRKKLLDFMMVGGVWGEYGGVAVVRKCVKDIIEKFDSTRSEYLFKSITIKRKHEIVDGDFYLLIIPKIDHRELILSKSIFRDSVNNCAVTFDNFDEYTNAIQSNNFSPISLSLPLKYQDLQMLYLGRKLGIYVSDKLAIALLLANSYADGYEFGIRLLFDE